MYTTLSSLKEGWHKNKNKIIELVLEKQLPISNYPKHLDKWEYWLIILSDVYVVNEE